MTWVTGTIPWGSGTTGAAAVLTRIICGEVPDGQGVTVAAGDRWVRDNVKAFPASTITAGNTTVQLGESSYQEYLNQYARGPGIPYGTTAAAWAAGTVTLSAAPTQSGTGLELYTDAIRTPASQNVASGDMPNRCGYFANVGTGTANNLATPNAAVARVTAPYTAAQAGGYSWSVRIAVTGANTVAGTYSNLAASYWVQNLETQAVPVNGTALTISAAGVATLTGGLQVTFSDPSGIVPVGTSFVRAFAPQFMFGIDWWPMWHRAAGPAAFGTPPPGVQGTDWDVWDQVTPYGGHSTYTLVNDRHGLMYGLGIKTATGLGNGDRYTVSFPMAKGKCRIFNGSAAGTFSLDVGGSRVDRFSQMNRSTGVRVSTWAKAFTSAGSVTGTTTLQYLMSVTADGIVLILNGDPVATGKTGTSYYCAFDPADPVYDKFPMAFNAAVNDYVSDNPGAANFYPAVQYPYWSLRRRQDGTADAVRDWQTGFMRCEHQYWNSSYNYSGSVSADVTVGIMGGSQYSPPWLGTAGLTSYTAQTTHQMIAPGRQNKPGPDGRWWLYPMMLTEGDWSGLGNAADENRIMRGKMNRFRFFPEDGWANWDEVTDVDAGVKWLLLKPDYIGAGARFRVAASTHVGGIAIREA